MQLSRFVLPAVLTLGSAVPLLTPAAVQAHEAPRHEVRYHHRHRDFQVYFRRSVFEPWHYYGCFDDRPDARCAAERLEHQGFFIKICR
jgi:hypothetical protein